LLNSLQKWHLEQYCLRHNLDPQEIDNSLTYEENLNHLKELTGLEEEDLLDESKAMEDWYESRSLEELYGEIDETVETPFLIFRFYIRIPFRLTRIVRTRTLNFQKHIRELRGYIEVRGQIREIYEVIKVLPPQLEIVGRDLEHQREWQYITNKGWVRRPS